MIDVHRSHVIENRCKLLELRVFVFILYWMIMVLGLLAFLQESFFFFKFYTKWTFLAHSLRHMTQ